MTEQGRYPCDHKCAQADGFNGPVLCHCGARWPNAEAYVADTTNTCKYCEEGEPRVQEVLPNGETIWAHWTRGKHGSVCHECKAVRHD